MLGEMTQKTVIQVFFRMERHEGTVFTLKLKKKNNFSLVTEITPMKIARSA
jgi:hypothetical protein